VRAAWSGCSGRLAGGLVLWAEGLAVAAWWLDGRTENAGGAGVVGAAWCAACGGGCCRVCVRLSRSRRRPAADRGVEGGGRGVE
jgi:hypothetical protein